MDVAIYDLPPYDLAGLCILSWLHLGEPISTVSAITNRVVELFPSLQTQQLHDQVEQSFQNNPCLFLYTFEDQRCLNYIYLRQQPALFRR